MQKHFAKHVFLLLMFGLLLGLLPQPAYAVWHALLDEDFNRDLQIENNRWPWFTDLRNNLRWHWNPRPAHFRSEGDDRTNYGWGLQDHIYNIRIRPQDEFQQALWCAVTNLNDPDSPRWPEDENYMNNQNAWVWWGPVDLTDAVSAGVSFWFYLDLEHIAGDSLSAIAVNRDPADLTDENFFNNVPIGRSFTHRIVNDWSQQIFYLDSLVLAGDEDNLVSMLGEDEVWIGFVWQSDGGDIAGSGAYIDDLIFSWDDGLFDIVPNDIFLGYPINEDSTRWTDTTPLEDEEIQFMVTFVADGLGETPEFTVDLYLDDEQIYTEDISVVGSPVEVYSVTADVLWAATPGDHVIRWELDTPIDDGRVDESDDDNNSIEMAFHVIHNVAPVLNIISPADDPTPLPENDDALISFTVRDTLDDNVRITWYWTTDTTGIYSDPSVFDEFGFIGRSIDLNRQEPLYEGVYSWDWERDEDLQPEMVFWIVGIAVDGWLDNHQIAVSPGRFYFPLSVASTFETQLPTESGIQGTYPNPFNDSVKIGYDLSGKMRIRLSVFDVSGRHIQTLIAGEISGGRHDISWRPENNTAGVYLLRLETPDIATTRKVIYLP
ncbi:MAG: T9SS type A sorting domain-containing protein [Calditrichaeota bacterium]|nr:T9SS type A sorting domain-containing protein [Calditrichota bacterium]